MKQPHKVDGRYKLTFINKDNFYVYWNYYYEGSSFEKAIENGTQILYEEVEGAENYYLSEVSVEPDFFD